MAKLVDKLEVVRAAEVEGNPELTVIQVDRLLTVFQDRWDSLLAALSTRGSIATAEDVTHLLCLFDTDALMGDALYGAGTADQCDMLVTAFDDFCAGSI